MGKIILFAVVLTGLSVGYLIWNATPTTPKDQTFTGYTQGLQSSEQKAQIAVATTNLSDVQQAVEKYKTDKGSLPSSLQDLVPNYLDHVPGGVQYDPASGQVSATP
jgi:hypothetical protein